MKIAIITDQHFGARNDSTYFLDYYEKFYSELFFPILQRDKIDTCLILGDTFDRRKYINFYTLQRANKMFFEPLEKMGINAYMLIGNHDTYYKNTNDVNSPELLLKHKNLVLIDKPRDIVVGDVNICMLPWISPEIYDESMNYIEKTRARICMGHLEIEGFQMYSGMPAAEGLSTKIFKKFDKVFSGHYHHKSSRGNIHYLGNPYELTWQDFNDRRGFHIFDVKTLELTFIPNPNTMFEKIMYDDKDVDVTQLTGEITGVKNKYIKVVVVNKTNPYVFDIFMSNLYKAGPTDITIVENTEEVVDDTVDIDQAEDTPTILNKYVDNLSTELNKDKIKSILKEIHIEALNEETT